MEEFSDKIDENHFGHQATNKIRLLKTNKKAFCRKKMIGNWNYLVLISIIIDINKRNLWNKSLKFHKKLRNLIKEENSWKISRKTVG